MRYKKDSDVGEERRQMGLHTKVDKLSQTEKKEDCLGVLVCVCMLMGMAWVLLSGFPMLASIWWMYGIGCALAAMLLFEISRTRYHVWELPVWLGLICLTAAIKMAEIQNGFCVLANEWLKFLTGKTGNIYLDFPVSGETGVWLLAALAFALLTLCLVRIIQNRSFLAAGLLFGLCMAGCAVGFLEAGGGLVMLAAGMAGFLMYRRMAGNSGKSGFLVLTGFLTVLLICGAAVFFAGAISDVKVSTEHAKLQLQKEVHQLRFDTGANALPEGNLVNPGSFQRSDEAALLVTAEIPQKLYIRGLTGEVYTGSFWEPLGEEARQEGEALFYWLHKSGFYGQSTIGKVMDLKGEGASAALHIENVSACSNHQYLPYALAGNEGLAERSVGDTANPPDTEISEFSIYSGSVPAWYEAASWLSQNQTEEQVKEYLLQEQSYREFVYAQDLQLTNAAVGVFERLFGEEASENRSLSEILELVRSTLEETLEYREDTVTYNGKNDFLKYTIEQSKCGYSIHYATAATLMLRYLGVPARYVEGYFLSAQEASGCEQGEAYPLTESHAHAWTEYYLDGIGWIPFEVTPGYVDEEELEAMSQLAANGLGDGNGKAFRQSTLTYTPPKYPEDNENKPDWNSFFRFQTWQLLLFLVLFLAALLLLGSAWIWRRRRRLLQFYRDMEETDNRNAIVGLYGYAVMLLKKCGLKQLPEQAEQIRFLNLEARFSSHELENEKRQQMMCFAEETVRLCKKESGFWKRLRYHYIFWLYR